MKNKGKTFLNKDKATFTLRNAANLFIVSELDKWSQDLNAGFLLKYCFFGAVMLTKNPDPDRYSYSGYWYWI